ncbi:MAG: hypothetical protein WBL55_22370, partial [Xanthobacteraceae bacterium]
MSQWTASRQQAVRPKHFSPHHLPQHTTHHPVAHAAYHHQPAPHAAPPQKQPPREMTRWPDAKERSADQAAARSAYTLTDAGRQVRLGPVAFWIGVGTLVIMAGWSVAAATYLTFRDDVLRTL